MDDIGFASYADENTTYTLENDAEIRRKFFFNGLWITKWKLPHTNITLSAVLMIQLTCLIVENQITDNSTCEKLPGVKFHYKLTFNAHIDDIYRKSGLKLNPLSRITPYMDFHKNGY